MRLFDAIIEANHRAAAGDAQASLHPDDFADALPVVALTCIDPRLNPLLPQALGLGEEQFIWLRNAGNIITGPLSSTMRSLALACAIKGGKEIAILGHTDCRVRQATTLDLTEGFRKLGIERGRLPDNLNEFFGLFASESQNVRRGVEWVRQSPLIGPKVPVHGLMLDLPTGRLDWLVNGYQALATATSAKADTQAQPAASGPAPMGGWPEFKVEDMKFPEMKIGELATTVSSVIQAATPPAEAAAAPAAEKPRAPAPKFEARTMFKVVGEDRKVYGPVTGAELEKWLAEDRITPQNLAQKVGYKEWKPLGAFAVGQDPPKIPLPPPLKGPLRLRAPWGGRKG
jgi:carbonic anhydrase